ncbi:MAG: PDZ domain-containing protein [Phycisphaerales bacterium]|nr:PDZ domain-containing protein [Phycisphaerales bacterium]
MNRNRVLALVAIALYLVTAPTVRAQMPDHLQRADLKLLQNSFADISAEAAPSVVAIRTYINGFGRGERSVLRPLSQGAGMIIRSNGTILTNYHVIEDATDVTVILHDGSDHDAGIVQVDPRSDVAILKIAAENLRPVKFRDLSAVRVGHWTFAVGNPFGLGNQSGKTSFTVGNVSSIGRNLTPWLDETDNRYYGNLIESSAAINPGNSGGPLFNLDGEVIGIVTAIETRTGVAEGVGFAIPITARTLTVVNQLERGEEVRYGYLGVTVMTDAPSRFHSVGDQRVHGAQLGDILTDGPAERAGLRSGDIIVELDGNAVTDADHLVRLVGATPVGSPVSARFVRDGDRRTASVTLGDRPIAERQRAMVAGVEVPTTNWRGALFAEITDPVRTQLGLAPGDPGLVVINVYPGSDAAKRGLEVDQVVVAVNDRPIRSLEQFADARNVAADTLRLALENNRVIQFDVR